MEFHPSTCKWSLGETEIITKEIFNVDCIHMRCHGDQGLHFGSSDVTPS